MMGLFRTGGRSSFLQKKNQKNLFALQRQGSGDGGVSND
jgi:hypothetical protein